MRVESNSFNPIDIAVSGMRGQGRRLQDIFSGVAGIGKASDGSGPSEVAGSLGSAVTMDDLPQQMINMTSATRAYEANVAVLKRYERMVETTLELLR